MLYYLLTKEDFKLIAEATPSGTNKSSRYRDDNPDEKTSITLLELFKGKTL